MSPSPIYIYSVGVLFFQYLRAIISLLAFVWLEVMENSVVMCYILQHNISYFLVNVNYVD